MTGAVCCAEAARLSDDGILLGELGQEELRERGVVTVGGEAGCLRVAASAAGPRDRRHVDARVGGAAATP